MSASQHAKSINEQLALGLGYHFVAATYGRETHIVRERAGVGVHTTLCCRSINAQYEVVSDLTLPAVRVCLDCRRRYARARAEAERQAMAATDRQAAPAEEQA